MIIETVCNFACALLSGLFSTLEVFSLPFDTINSLTAILQYGTWVVGSDILLLFTGSVALWWGVKASIGIGVWVYEHLPFIG